MVRERPFGLGPRRPRRACGFAAASKGKMLLGVAVGLITFGMFCIKKITTVKV